ncbi:hypothetical protein [Candidatus Hydrogenosomobacter endosymbioticus]|uniref:Uncharacterized protein n=1 Tax=Candidatus Hydrogenosomobacter endosymbioticus TaxID=2558174 RepID=A0ABM7VA27_9PROT|nr:hypothetical protein [Candidatus Hydrogenosomobacter endosymbioticus]BDB96329.1 hypothetical protein HYD_4620 [Candidatus Hydrogenosomobacter endosymbioticus]
MKKISIIYLAALSAATLCSYDASAGPILSKAKDGISFVFDNKKTVIPVVGVVGLFVINNKFKILNFNNIKNPFSSGNNNDDHSMRIKGDNNNISGNNNTTTNIFNNYQHFSKFEKQDQMVTEQVEKGLGRRYQKTRKFEASLEEKENDLSNKATKIASSEGGYKGSMAAVIKKTYDTHERDQQELQSIFNDHVTKKGNLSLECKIFDGYMITATDQTNTSVDLWVKQKEEALNLALEQLDCLKNNKKYEIKQYNVPINQNKEDANIAKKRDTLKATASAIKERKDAQLTAGVNMAISSYNLNEKHQAHNESTLSSLSIQEDMFFKNFCSSEQYKKYKELDAAYKQELDKTFSKQREASVDLTLDQLQKIKKAATEEKSDEQQLKD